MKYCSDSCNTPNLLIRGSKFVIAIEEFVFEYDYDFNSIDNLLTLYERKAIFAQYIVTFDPETYRYLFKKTEL